MIFKAPQDTARLVTGARAAILFTYLGANRFAMSMPQGGYVAIVDDDVSMRKGVASLLRAHGIDAQTYGSARDFLAALPSGMPDCLITDLNMPHMSGLELQRELMRLGAPIPTIVVTGCSNASARTGHIGQQVYRGRTVLIGFACGPFVRNAAAPNGKRLAGSHRGRRSGRRSTLPGSSCLWWRARPVARQRKFTNFRWRYWRTRSLVVVSISSLQD